MTTPMPTCRWGIVSTGFISTWFVEDLMRERKTAQAKHIIQAVGGSSIQKARDFTQKNCQAHSPQTYGSYEQVYTDPEVDCVYIGTPHALHKKNCLDAIAAGKNVLCEKAFTLNASEAEEVIDAARKKGVYIAEAMWLRHRPLVHKLRELLYQDRAIGEVFRMSSDFGLRLDLPNLPSSSRYKDPSLGAGSLLDIGIYPLTWAILTLDPDALETDPGATSLPSISAAQAFEGQVEITTSVILHYKNSGRIGMISSTTNANHDPSYVCRVDGTRGSVEIHGSSPSLPRSFTVYPPVEGDANKADLQKPEGKKYDDFDNSVTGLVYEADNTAIDLAAGRKESPIMPWMETIRVMKIMDEIRRQGGTKYAADVKV